MNISDFRKDLKLAFDDALRGEAVVVERGGVRYQLIADGVMPKIISRVGPDIIPTTPMKDKLPTTRIAPSRLDNGLCKVHGLPLDARGRCLQKGCKYS